MDPIGASFSLGLKCRVLHLSNDTHTDTKRINTGGCETPQRIYPSPLMKGRVSITNSKSPYLQIPLR